MRRLWMVLYNVLIVPILWTGFHLLALVHAKTRRGIRGRKHLLSSLTLQTTKLDHFAGRIWFHASSLGEFEQAKPIIAELKRRHPELAVIVSFFSPSGYDHSKNYRFADLITYIPFDSYSRAREFVRVVRPTAAVLVRYDVWPNHLWALADAGVPAFIANATLSAASTRHWPIARSFHRCLYDSLCCILTVSENDVEAFRRFNLTRPTLVAIGDTRFDQVQLRSREAKSRHIFPAQVIEGKKIFVIGSSWGSDESVLIPALGRLVQDEAELAILFVPHEPTAEHLENIESELEGLSSFIRFSNLQDYHDERVIIIDSVGVLMALYQYAHVAYVGGSFREGIHNVLEPAVYGIPVLFGPKHENSQEAIELVKEGAAYVVRNADEMYNSLRHFLSDDTARIVAGQKARQFVERNTGATERFLSYLEKVL